MKIGVKRKIINQAQRIVIGLFFLMTLILWLTNWNPRQNIEKIALNDLNERITQDNGVIRIDYVDDQGQLRIVSDLGYSSVVKSESDGIVFEQYLDDKGNNTAAPGGYYFASKSYDEKGNNTRVEYYDSDGKPMIISTGCAIEEKSYNTEGKMTSVYYYDTMGEPVCTRSYGYGRNYEYDSNGHISKITFLNTNGDPYITGLGYAIVKRTYYDTTGPENGKTKYEFYYDENMEPISLSLGQYGIYKEYDERGNNSEIVYLDIDGNPKLTNHGYSKVVCTYHKDNTIAIERYFDLDGNPVCLAEGQYGKKTENGKTVFLNADGSEQFNLKNIIYNNKWYVIILAFIIMIVSSASNKKINIGFLVLYIGGIIYLTLMFRDVKEERANLELLWSYKKMFISTGAMKDIFRNIWLFIPLGAILYRLFPHKFIILIPILLSFLIELTQYITKTGLCELDDIISNGLGGAIGYALESEMHHFLSKIKKRERHFFSLMP